jgi:ribose transport system permease protein
MLVGRLVPGPVPAARHLLVLVVVIGDRLEPGFLEPARRSPAAADTAVLFILATGVTFVIMLGGIDLSIQAVASLASVILPS